MLGSFRPWKLIRSLHLRRRFGKGRIPEGLEGCLARLADRPGRNGRERFKSWPEEDVVGRTHFGLGLWMRNNWGLWSDSPLGRHFNEMGIFHADDMSAIIILSHHRRLNGKDIGLAEQVAFYKNWWKGRQGGPSFADCEQLRCLEQALADHEGR